VLLATHVITLKKIILYMMFSRSFPIICHLYDYGPDSAIDCIPDVNYCMMVLHGDSVYTTASTN